MYIIIFNRAWSYIVMFVFILRLVGLRISLYGDSTIVPINKYR